MLSTFAASNRSLQHELIRREHPNLAPAQTTWWSNERSRNTEGDISVIKRLLYGSGAAGALAAAYLLGSLTVGGAFAASPTPTSSIAPAVSQSASMGSQATPGTASRSSSTAAGTTDQGT